MNSSCYVYFKISGIFNPEEIIEMLELKPYDYHKIGDLRFDGVPFDFAQLELCYDDNYDGNVDEQMRNAIKPLFKKVDILNYIKKEFQVEYYIEVVPSIDPNDLAPILAPSLEIMKFCCDTFTNIDIDLYFK